MNTNAAGVALIKRWESLALEAYLCPANKWTIGYGHTGDVRPGMVITAHQAEAILDVDLDKFGRDVEFLTKGLTLNANEFSALVSFAFNLGSDIDADDIAEGLGDSTLLKKLLRGDKTGASREFIKWNKARNKKGELVVLAGLTARRMAERDLFLAPVPA